MSFYFLWYERHGSKFLVSAVYVLMNISSIGYLVELLKTTRIIVEKEDDIV